MTGEGMLRSDFERWYTIGNLWAPGRVGALLLLQSTGRTPNKARRLFIHGLHPANTLQLSYKRISRIVRRKKLLGLRRQRFRWKIEGRAKVLVVVAVASGSEWYNVPNRAREESWNCRRDRGREKGEPRGRKEWREGENGKGTSFYFSSSSSSPDRMVIDPVIKRSTLFNREFQERNRGIKKLFYPPCFVPLTDFIEIKKNK